MNKSSDQELIDHFLRRELTAEEQILWEERKKSKDFLLLLSQTESIVEIVSKQGRKQLKTEMQEWYREGLHSKNKKNNTLRWLLVAAAVTALFWGIHWSNRYERLSNDFAVGFPDYISQITRAPGADRNEYAEVMQLYQNEDWAAAIDQLEQYLVVNPNDYKIRLYKGIALYRIQDYKTSKRDFQWVLENTDDATFFEPARWYLILAYVAIQEIDNAKTLLNVLLANKDHFQYAEAVELMNDLQ